MSQWTGEQRAFAIEAYFKANDSCAIARRRFCSRYNIRRSRDAPSEDLIRLWVRRFRATSSAENKPRPGPSRTSRTNENIELVAASLRDNPVRKRAAALGLPRTIVHEILKKDLKFHPFKIQIVQALKPNDHNMRKKFCETMLERFRTVNTIFWSDEAHFHLNGSVNKQNCRYWSPKRQNPRLKHQQPLHSPKVTVWCALSSRGIIGPYFFENRQRQLVSVDGVAYRRMLNDYLFPTLREHPAFTSQTWFQQDGATPHTARETMALLRDFFPSKLISRFGDIPWPPRSPDLTPMDFFLWGYLKSKVYETSPATISELKENIVREVNGISAALLQRVARNTEARFQECIRRNGQHLDDVIFQK